MIHATVNTFSQYYGAHARFEAAWTALKNQAKKPFVTGRHEVDGDNIYIVALDYETKPEADKLMEAHRSYIDIMLLCEGEEIIGYQPLDTLTTITSEYSADIDALLAKIDSSYTKINMVPGNVAVFFPEDAHAPGINLSETKRVRKLIAKVLV